MHTDARIDECQCLGIMGSGVLTRIWLTSTSSIMSVFRRLARHDKLCIIAYLESSKLVIISWSCCVISGARLLLARTYYVCRWMNCSSFWIVPHYWTIYIASYWSATRHVRTWLIKQFPLKLSHRVWMLRSHPDTSQCLILPDSELMVSFPYQLPE